jgi:hypothetical protein
MGGPEERGLLQYWRLYVEIDVGKILASGAKAQFCL